MEYIFSLNIIGIITVDFMAEQLYWLYQTVQVDLIKWPHMTPNTSQFFLNKAWLYIYLQNAHIMCMA